MASRYEVEVTLSSAKDLKNVNWRNGKLNPYVVVWIDPKAKCSTVADQGGDTCPQWNESLVIPLFAPIKESLLFIDVVHAGAVGDRDTKPLIGSARLPLSDVVDDVNIGDHVTRTLHLKRPSGRPQGKVEVKVCVRDPSYRAPDPYYAPPYGVPPPGSREFTAPAPYGNAYAPPPPLQQQQYGAPPPPYGAQSAGYPYNAYGAPPPLEPQYGQQSNYGQGQVPYGQQMEQKKASNSKFGMGAGLAVGAVAGALGGLALVEGVDYVEDKIEDDVADKVEDDLAYDDDDDDDDD